MSASKSGPLSTLMCEATDSKKGNSLFNSDRYRWLLVALILIALAIVIWSYYHSQISTPLVFGGQLKAVRDAS